MLALGTLTLHVGMCCPCVDSDSVRLHLTMPIIHYIGSGSPKDFRDFGYLMVDPDDASVGAASAASTAISRGVDAEPQEAWSIMSSDAVWNSQRAAVVGAILGAAYALWICYLANIITLPLIAVVSLAIGTSAVCGAALLGGFARFLN